MKNDEARYKELLGYEPSEYQKKIFDFVLHGTGNAVIKARAGSGKTATLITSMRLVPDKKRCLFLAFNRSVRDEITEKLAGQDNCSVMTVHSLGYRMIMSNYQAKPAINDFKYSQFLKTNIRELSSQAPEDKAELAEYIERTLLLINFGRLALCQTRNELLRVAVKHDIDFKFDEIDVALAVMEWGKGCVVELDYTDMVWLPNELDLNPKQFKFDWIFNDEAQDYSEAYVKLFMRCFKRGTRFVSTGDDYQSINMFAGASTTAFEEMVNYKNTTLFTLPISYRCDRAIIDEARILVEDIEPRPTAGPGIVVQDSHIRDINGDDMVLCRTNAPLVKMFTMLIDRNKPCYIKGKDDDKKRFIETVERFAVGEELGKDLNRDGLFPRLYDNMLEERNKRMLHGLDAMDAISSPSVQSKYDTITALLIIAKNCRTKTELVNRINRIFSGSNTGICLSTIHKAKGLESNNVHILCRSLMPSKSAKTKDEIQQENNLIYVAVTRARHKLCYVSETEFPPAKAFDGDGDALSEFRYIETKICRLYGKEPVDYMSDGEMARFRLTSSSNTNIDDNPIHRNDNAKRLSSVQTTPFERKRKSLLDNL